MLNSDIYRDQANYWKNSLIIDRTIKACVHLEDEDDIFFWNTILQKYNAGSIVISLIAKAKKRMKLVDASSA